MLLTDRFLVVTDAFCAAHGLTREQLSYRVFRDQRRIGRVAAGDAGLTVRSLEAALQYLSDEWPDDLDWCGGLPRPAPCEPRLRSVAVDPAALRLAAHGNRKSLR